MTIVKHELMQGKKAFLIWTLSIAFFMVICVVMFPEMKDNMAGVNDMFSSMGSFTQAFSMDKINFGTFLGYYAIECGNVLGLGGAFFAAIVAIAMLSKEETEHTAEFLLTHPISRTRVITEKLIAAIIEVIIMNIVIYLMSVATVALIGETVPWKELTLLHTAYLIMQVEIAGICFGLSAFLRRGSLGIGLGLATVLYFMNIIANISDSAKFLKYITPYSYSEGADIIVNGSIDTKLVLFGMAYMVIVIVAGYLKYSKKDIH